MASCEVPNFKPLCGKTWEQVLANVLGKARTKTASNNNHELNDVREKFNLFIQHISPTLPDFWDWHCRRIDYAITLKNKNTATYIKLFKAGNLSKTFYKKADNYSSLEGSLYVPSNSDKIRLNFYDKHAQLRELKGIVNDITKTSDNLRIEVQCNRKKLDHLRKKFNTGSNTVKNMLDLEICQYIITSHYNMICDVQSYFSFSMASEQLHTHQSKLNYSADELIKTLEIIRLRGSIWKSKINFFAGLNAFDKRIRDIKNIGINPVTLPDNLQITHLPNLYIDVKKIFETIELGILD